MPTTHYGTCNLCEAMCGLIVETNEDDILSIRANPDDPLSRGHICPKAVALQDIYHDPDRLKHPVKRTATGWQRLTWEEAFAEVASRLKAVQAQHGHNAVGIFQGNPNVHNVATMLFSPPFVKALRTKNRYSATSVDQLPHHVAAQLMYGHQLLLPVPDIDHTHFMLIMGANPLVSNGSMMSAPGMRSRLKALQDRGGSFVVVDPRRTETALMADQHLFIYPGQDALLLLALLHTFFAEGLVELGHLADSVRELATLEQISQAYTPESLSAQLGIEASTIRQLARDFATAPSAVCYGRMGLSTQAYGGLCQWLINALNILTGNLDRRGGAMFSLPAIDVVALTGGGGIDRWRSRVRDLPESGGEFPVATLADEMLTPGEGQIRALVTVAGNPVLSTPNGQRLSQALASLDFMVSVDIYLNETTRHADIILPPTTGLENLHYDLVFHNLAVRNTAKYSPAIMPASEDGRSDWQIFKALRERLLATPADDMFARWEPAQILDMALRYGPYGARGGHPQALTLAKLSQGSGVDLGALEPCLPARLRTQDKQINVAPELFLADLKRLDAEQANEQQAGFDLALIGRRDLRSNNSWMHNSERLLRGKARCTLLMHPADAQARGIHTGDTVTVRSRVGEVMLPVVLTQDIMPGVVSMPHGWGHAQEGVQLRVAQSKAGVSINDLTDDRLIDKATGNAALSGVRVSVLLVA